MKEDLWLASVTRQYRTVLVSSLRLNFSACRKLTGFLLVSYASIQRCGTIAINDCSIKGNTIHQSAIYIEDSNAKISALSLEQNSAKSGVMFLNSTFTMQDIVMEDNQWNKSPARAQSSSGHFLNLTISNSTLSDTGIEITDSNCTITGATFTDTVAELGGALYLQASDVTLLDSSFM